MSNRTTDPSPFICGLDAALRIVGGKWKMLILHFLGRGSMRYGELKRSVRGVSDKMLIQQLKELETHGAIARIDHKEIPPRVDYSLTPFGYTLVEAVAPLCQWGERNVSTIASVLSR